MVHPLALGGHVVDAEPDLPVRADALTDVVPEPVVLLAGGGSSQDAAQRVAVLTGSVVALLQRVGQETFPMDLFTF